MNYCLIVICPVAAATVVGLNCTCNVTDCAGFNVTGRFPPTIVKPAPVIEAEFTVTGVVPVEVSVNGYVVAVFTVTLPKSRLPPVNDRWELRHPRPCIGTWASGFADASAIVSCPE